MTIKGLIFDFDGLILDTETPDVIAWMEVFKKYGQKFDFDQYQSAIGSVYRFMAPAEDLAREVHGVDAEEIFTEWTLLEKSFIEKQKIMPGILEYLNAARGLNINIAIASSSERPWVVGHLERLGIRDYFDSIHTVDETNIPKPDPSLYRMALRSLNTKAEEAIAFEDSVHGISAAKAAGIFCVAVPNQITRFLNLNHADLIIDSLANLPLPQLLMRFQEKI